MDTFLEAETLLDQCYEIVKLLGRGDFGVVYQARDQGVVDGMLKFVPIKQMPMQMIVNCERQSDFQLRARCKQP